MFKLKQQQNKKVTHYKNLNNKKTRKHYSLKSKIKN